jgi:hypothetical protein
MVGRKYNPNNRNEITGTNYSCILCNYNNPYTTKNHTNTKHILDKNLVAGDHPAIGHLQC